MFSTDTDLEIGASAPAAFHANLNQFADAFLVEDDERIMSKDTAFDVLWQKHASIVPAQAQCRLGEIIGAIRKKIRLTGNRPSGEDGPRQFDHGTNQVRQAYPMGPHDTPATSWMRA
jgi:hypothetical protein